MQRTTSSVADAWLPRLFAATGLVLMLATLTLPSYWTDEGATIEMARRPLARLLATTSHIDGVHAFYYVVMHAWIGVFGAGEFALRLPSAIFYAVTVFVTVRIAQDLRFSTRASAAVGALMLVLPGITWVGLEARDFALATILATLNMRAFLCMTIGGSSARWGWRVWATTFAVTAVLMPLAEIYTVMLWPLQAAWLAVTARRRLRQWALLLAPAFLTTVALMGVLRQQTGQLSPSEDLAMRCWALVRGVFFYGPRNGRYDPMWPYVLTQVAAALTLGFLIAAVWRRSRLVWWLSLSAFAPMLTVFMIAWVNPAMFGEHYFAFCAPGLVLAFVAAVEHVATKRAAGVLTALVLLCAPMQLTQRAQSTKAGDDYRTLVASMPSERPDAVWFDLTSARSVRSAYPKGFAGVTDVRLRRSGLDSDSLWGENVDPRASLLRLRAERPRHLLVVFGRSGLARSSGAGAARELGCSLHRVVKEGRYSFAYYTCPHS